jgi:hypothetical protein
MMAGTPHVTVEVSGWNGAPAVSVDITIIQAVHNAVTACPSRPGRADYGHPRTIAQAGAGSRACMRCLIYWLAMQGTETSPRALKAPRANRRRARRTRPTWATVERALVAPVAVELERRRTAGEEILHAAGLSRAAWRALHVDVEALRRRPALEPHEAWRIDESRHLNWSPKRAARFITEHDREAFLDRCRTELFRFIVRHPKEECARVSWAAGMAAAADAALATTDPDVRYLLGGFIDRCRTLLNFEQIASRVDSHLAEKRGAEGGHAKKGKYTPHVRLVRATVAYLHEQGRAISLTEVVRCLMDVPTEIAFRLSKAEDPVELPEQDVVDEDDEGRVTFRFQNRPEATISRKTLRNIIAQSRRFAGEKVRRESQRLPQ